MGSEPDELDLPERLQWTLAWQSRKLMPRLAQPDAEQRLRAYWTEARRMDEVLARVSLTPSSLSVDVGGGLTTPLRWLPGRRLCIDPLAEHYGARFDLPHDRVSYALGHGECLPLAGGTVDLVVCTNCIDHTDDPWAVVREIWRVLRPGGWLWFSCEVNPPDQERNAGHPHALDRGALERLVAAFEVVLVWEEPWRGAYRFLMNEEPFPAVELGFLLRKGRGRDAE
ncbi:MAG: class I SAM-dependent methyltransferase [Myxococcota bacterium]